MWKRNNREAGPYISIPTRNRGQSQAHPNPAPLQPLPGGFEQPDPVKDAPARGSWGWGQVMWWSLKVLCNPSYPVVPWFKCWSFTFLGSCLVQFIIIVGEAQQTAASFPDPEQADLARGSVCLSAHLPPRPQDSLVQGLWVPLLHPRSWA